MLLRVAVIAGIVLRLVQYLWRQSYWHDEAYLVLNVTSLTYRQLVGPLPHAQSAPPGFLLAQKALFDMFGSSELVLRLLPLLLGCAAVVLMAILARRVLEPVGALTAVALFVLSDRLIAHAVEAKQYSGDVFLALVLLLVATSESRTATRRLLIASLIAAAALWFSHPIIFVFGGIGLALLPAFLREARGRGALTFALCCLPAVLSFVALYVLSIRHQEVGDLYAYWADRFPDWQRPWMLPLWLIRMLIGLCRYPYEFGGEAVFALALAGAWGMWRDGRRELLGVLLAPVGLTLLAALVGRYPFGGSRVTLFLAPAMFVLAGYGLQWLLARAPHGGFWRGPVIAVPVILVVIGGALAAWYLAFPRNRGHIRPAVEFIRAHRTPGEPIYVIGEEESFLCYWRDPGQLLPIDAADAPKVRDERFWIVSATGNEPDARKVQSAAMRTADALGAPRRTIAYRGGAAYQFVSVRRPAATTTRGTTTRPSPSGAH